MMRILCLLFLLLPVCALALPRGAGGVLSNQTITGLTLSNQIVTPGIASGVVVGTGTVTVSNGSAAAATLALSNSGSCPSPGTNNSNYSIASMTLSTAANIPSETDAICISVTLATATNSPQYYSFTMSVVDTPGTSPNLAANPPYTCSTNRYVSTVGNDSWDGTSPTFVSGTTGPWLTPSKASTASGNTCVDYLSGTYVVQGSGTNILTGGTSESAYLVWRSYTPASRAVIQQGTTPAAGGMFGMFGNFIWFDNLELDGNATGCSGHSCVGDYGLAPGNGGTSAHNYHVTNMYIHDMGGGGIGAANTGDCFRFEHNVTARTSSLSTFQESGINVFAPTNVTGLTSCGWADADAHHIIIAWNDSHLNFETWNGSHSDGDGIILDTCGSYSYTIRVSNNVTYGDGGFAIGTDNCPNILIANNTMYNDYLDNSNTGTFRSLIYLNGCVNCTVVNNVLQSAVGAAALSKNIGILIFGSSTGSVVTNNVVNAVSAPSCASLSGTLSGASGACYVTGNTISGASNKLATSPGWTTTPTAFSAVTTGASGTGSTATITYSGASLGVGALISVAGTTPTGYQAVATTTAASSGSASYASAATGAQTVAGAIVLLPTLGNYALVGGSAAIGYGTTWTGQPASDVDAGACGSALVQCPATAF